MKRTAWAFALGCCLLPCAPLAASAAAAQTGPGAFVEAPGGKLWYEACGSGPKTLVLLHDGGLDAADWNDVWPGLCKSFRVIRYDRRGYGRSPEAKAPYSNVDDLQEVMRAAGAGHAVLVGASYGSGVAVDFALAHPEEVDRLVLVGPELSGLPHSKRYLEEQMKVLEMRARGDLLGAIKLSQLFAPGDDANALRLVRLEQASPQNFNHQDPATPPPPAAPRLGEIKAPTMVLVGEYDVADYQAQAGTVEYTVHGSTRVVVPNAGHLVYLEQPAEFTDLVSRFAEGAASPGTEDALRRVLGELQRGAPDYSRMSGPIANLLRAQLGPIKNTLTALGGIKSISLNAVGTASDVFTVAFEHGSAEFGITLGDDGRIDGLTYRPLS